MKIIEIFKNILAPKKCYNCSTEGSFLCQKCLDKLGYFESVCYYCKAKTIKFDIHEYCQNEFVHYDKIIILTHYKNKVIKKLLHDAKFYKRKDILEDFGVFLGNKLIENIGEKEDILLIPTPMYFWKKIFRGYNQSEILVKSLASKFGFGYDLNFVKKVKKTKQQSFLSKIERIENLKGAFEINKNLLKKYKNKTMIIVDDVVSTGTTINEISKILKRNGIKKVYSIVIASD